MDNNQKLDEIKKTSKLIYDGDVLHVYKDEVTLPNGATAGREVVRHVGAVAIVPMTEDGKVIMEHQFRYPFGRVVTEIPAGKLDSYDEDRLDAAKRELREETGLTADHWTEIGDYYPAAAYTDERITMYLATGLHRGEQELDEDEFLHLEEIPLEDLLSDIMKGKIGDGKTLAALLKTALLLKKVRKYFRFEGRVQHVGFRHTAGYLAKKGNLTGWVRNEYDGTVTMEVQGEEKQIEKLLYELLHDHYIRIDDYRVEKRPLIPEERRFEVKR